MIRNLEEILGKKKKHKYGAKETVIDGIKFASKAEAQYYSSLKLLKRAGEIKDFQMQVPFILQEAFEKNGKKYPAIKYIADFVITYKDGRQEVVDIKGFRTKEYLLKRKLFENKYRHLTIKEERA